MKEDYALLSDAQWIELLLREPKDERGIIYFISVKCKAFLSYIHYNLFSHEEFDTVTNEFYIYISAERWKVVRQFKSLHGASLNTYLSVCTTRYFIQKKKEEIRERERLNVTSDQLYERLAYTDEEEEEVLYERRQKIQKAFAALKERDRKVLQLHLLEKHTYIEIADTLWPYVNTPDKDWRQLPNKRVQDTLAIIKKRALFNLYAEWVKIDSEL